MNTTHHKDPVADGSHGATVWEWKYEATSDGMLHQSFDRWDARIERGGPMEPGDRVNFEYHRCKNSKVIEGVVYNLADESGRCRVMVSSCGFGTGLVIGLFLNVDEAELSLADHPYRKPVDLGWGDDTPWNEGEES